MTSVLKFLGVALHIAIYKRNSVKSPVKNIPLFIPLQLMTLVFKCRPTSILYSMKSPVEMSTSGNHDLTHSHDLQVQQPLFFAE